MSKKGRARTPAKEAATSPKAPVPGYAAPSPAPNSFSARWAIFLAGGIVVFVALAVYHNSFSGPFILDDTLSITNNSSIRRLGSALFPPLDSGTGGRPLINLTFALNYVLSGFNVWGYHAFNLLIHALAGLVLFGIVRRTLLERPTSNLEHPTSKANHLLDGASNPRTISQESRFADALPLALAIAVIWTVHPLQTEAVTYISQRAESLMGLFYLLTFYCFIRSVECRSGFMPDVSGINPDLQSKRGNSPNFQFPALNSLSSVALAKEDQPSTFNFQLWGLASITSCLLGSMCKENIVTAPVMVLLYDRTFVAGSFREALRLRWRYYLGLATTWLLLARLMTSLGQRSVGFGQGVTWWSYALTSCRSVVLYLKLAVWPHPLVFDYGANIIQHTTEAVPYALILAVILVAVVMALRYQPIIGFAGAWFFVILAPTSSIVPVADQPMAEHRMYLPLAAVVALGVFGLHRLIGRRGLVVCAAAALGLGWLSVERNEYYCSALAIWNDTVTKCPDNARARYNLGNVLHDIPGRRPDSIAQFEAAVQFHPESALAHYNLGNALVDIPSRLSDAIAQFQTALHIEPDNPDVHNGLGHALAQIPGRLPDAMAECEEALRLKPDYAEAHCNLGSDLARIPGRLPDAMAECEEALRLKPDYAEAHYNLGCALAQIPGRLPDAMAEYKAALRLKPDYAEAHYNLGCAFVQIPGRLSDAIAEYQAALRLKPDYAEAHINLGSALMQIPGRLPDAIAEYQAVLHLKPDYAEAHYNLGRAFLRQGSYSAACDEYEKALKLKPNYAEGHANLGITLANMGRLNEAIAQFEAALKIKPDYPAVRRYLEQAQSMLSNNGGNDLGVRATP